jgi:hypothetical protein
MRGGRAIVGRCRTWTWRRHTAVFDPRFRRCHDPSSVIVGKIARHSRGCRPMGCSRARSAPMSRGMRISADVARHVNAKSSRCGWRLAGAATLPTAPQKSDGCRGDAWAAGALTPQRRLLEGRPGPDLWGRPPRRWRLARAPSVDAAHPLADAQPPLIGPGAIDSGVPAPVISQFPPGRST